LNLDIGSMARWGTHGDTADTAEARLVRGSLKGERYDEPEEQRPAAISA
jgi:hypothetical protein